MNKITVLGLVRQRRQLLKGLMSLGVVHIEQEDIGEEIKKFEGKVNYPDVQADLHKIDSLISDVSRSIEIMQKYVTVKKPLFSVRRDVPEDLFKEVMNDLDKWLEISDSINEYDDEIARLKSEENRITGLINSLVPWLELDIPLDKPYTRYTSVLMGSVLSSTDISKLEDMLYESCPESVLIKGASNRQHQFIAVIVHKDIESKAQEVLRRWDFNKISFRELSGTPKVCHENLIKNLESLKNKMIALNNAIKDLALNLETLEIVSDGLLMERNRIEAKSSLLTTSRAFILKGWLPAELSGKVKSYLDSNFYCTVEINEPDEDQEFPVLLENGPVVESITPVVNMYGTISSREVDPSPYVLPFFVFFFGLMLGDGGYGLLMSIASGIILLKFKLEDSTRRFMKLIFLCGIGSIIAGLLYGSWFAVSSLTHTALWIVPTENPELMLSWAMLFGIIHMYVGIFIRGLNQARRGKILGGIIDIATYYIFFTGFVLTLLPFAPGIDTSGLSHIVKAGNTMFAVGAALVIITQGRHSKNIFGKIFGGFAKLYDVVGFFGDTLSYTRLVALGLASAIIGDIVNTMATGLGGNIVITVVFGSIVIFVGHSINIGLNVLGAFVHSCRLQYLEFFGKFLEGGGEAFKPFKAKTKYILVNDSISEYLKSPDQIPG